MSVGYGITKPDIDSRAGQLVVSLRDDLVRILQFKAWLDDAATTDQFLAGLTYTAGDIATLRAAFTDLAKLSDISHAQAIQAVANDFWFNAKHLTGTL